MSRDSSPQPDKMTLRLKRRASRIFQMNEGRKSQIVLLDDRRLDIIIQPKLYSNDLLDLVASHFKLREKQYFGLGFVDETNHFNWLQGEKRVLDHEFPKKTGLLVLHFAIRFYVDTIGLLRDTQTVELFYLNARQALFRGQVVADSETVFELAAHVMQETNGDFTTEEETREDLKKLPVIPTSTLKEHPSIAYCEDRVICHYEKLNGTSRGLAIVNYMTIIEKLPTYGIHYYDVKDKKDIPWWLGISTKGIAIYDKNDKTTPRRLFTWKNLENLYYRDKKFSIEVHGPKREETGSHIIHTLSSFNPYEDAVRESADSFDDLSTAISDPSTQVSVSRRTFGASNVDVHAWFAGTAQLTKCIWSMAVAQHQFYLDRKQSKTQLPAARSMSEIAAELCQSSTSLPGSLGSDLSRSPSSHSLPSLSNSRYDLTIEQSDSQKAERDMYQALKARKEALEEALKKKTEQLKQLCLQEGELTGELPKELPLAPGEQAPVFRRRVGTAFSLSVKNVPDTNQTTTELSKLELEVELQGKITSAAQRLASDKTVSKYVRKQRRQSYTRAVTKLKEMEKKLGEMRKAAGKPTSERHSRAYQGTYCVSAPCSSPPQCDALQALVVDLVHDDKALSPTSSHQGGADSGCPSNRHSCASSLNSCGNSLHSYPASLHSEEHSYPASLHSGEHSPTSENALSTESGYKEGEEMSREPSQSSLNPSDDYRYSLSESDSASVLTGSQDCLSDTVDCVVKRRERNPSRSSPEKSFSMYFDEEPSPSNLTGARKKHIVVNRGTQNSRLQELKSESRSSKVRSRSSVRSSDQGPMRLAEAENDSVECRDLDGSLDHTDSEDEDLRLRREEHRYSTRVARRKQTFFLSRSLRKPLQLENSKHDYINDGYHMLERVMLEGDLQEIKRNTCMRAQSLPPDSPLEHRFKGSSIADPSPRGSPLELKPRGSPSEPRSRTSSFHKQRSVVNVKSSSSPCKANSVQSNSSNVSESDSHKVNSKLQARIQDLIDSTDVKPSGRSRSVDYSVDLRVNSLDKSQDSTLTMDDLKLIQSPEKSKKSPLVGGSVRKSFGFFNKKKDKPKQMKHSQSEIKASRSSSVFYCDLSSSPIPPSSSPKPIPSNVRVHADVELPVNGFDGDYVKFSLSSSLGGSFEDLSTVSPVRTLTNPRAVSEGHYSVKQGRISNDLEALFHHKDTNWIEDDDKDKLVVDDDDVDQRGEEEPTFDAEITNDKPEEPVHISDERNLKFTKYASEVGSIVCSRDSADRSTNDTLPSPSTLKRQASWHSSSQRNSIRTHSKVETTV